MKSEQSVKNTIPISNRAVWAIAVSAAFCVLCGPSYGADAAKSDNGVASITSGAVRGLGGSGARGESIALDSKGNVYLGGTTPGTLPTTSGAFDTTFNGGTSDAFIAKFNTTFNDTIGVFQPATLQFQLRDSNSANAATNPPTTAPKT